MQNTANLPNNLFVEEYSNVLSHHINCILKSSMILDEDMQLVTTFWIPNSTTKRSFLSHSTLASVTCASAGLFYSLRLRNLYVFTVGVVPAALQLCNVTKRYYWEQTYKRNFEKLVDLVRELYELSRNIIEYYHKKDTLSGNRETPDDISMLLLRPGQEFLNKTVSLLMSVLEKLKNSMHEICRLVPIKEGEHIYALKWNLEDFKKYEDADFRKTKHHLEMLCDLYVLMTSNFLGCLGLSLCVQLWEEVCCDFRKIFDVLIPDLRRFLNSALSEIKMHFSRIRFTLPNTDTVPKEKPKNNLQQVQRPLSEFLTHLQTTFETTKKLELLIEQDNVQNYEHFIPVIEDVSSQFAVCDVTLNMLVRLLYFLSKKPLVQKHQSVPPPRENSNTRTEIHFDDPEEVRGDEEYNLSIHGSDSGDSIDAIYDYADHCSTDHLELMLCELKKKLDERKGTKGKTDDEPPPITMQPTSHEGFLNAVRTIAQNSCNEKTPPVPPPPPPIVQLPTIDSSHRGFLDAVRTIAQNLNRDEEFQFGFNMFPEIPRPFNTTYRCYSVAMLPGNERTDVERGGKIIMPPSALEQLTRLNINYPMLFKIVNKKTDRTTHCGVLEFVADEGKVYLPLWMMHNLVLEEGDMIQIESVSLPVGTFAKFQPLSPDFLDITNPKAVLENCLRTFACLTSGDVIAVRYNQKAYELCVLETQPGNAISIIECDMNVEFAPPVGYRESEEVKQSEEDMMVDPADLMPEPSGFVAFRGTGNRLDGKRRKDSTSSDTGTPKPVYVRGIPDYDYEIGTLRFLRHITQSPASSKEENEEFKAFSGEGFSLKQRN